MPLSCLHFLDHFINYVLIVGSFYWLFSIGIFLPENEACYDLYSLLPY